MVDIKCRTLATRYVFTLNCQFLYKGLLVNAQMFSQTMNNNSKSTLNRNNLHHHARSIKSFKKSIKISLKKINKRQTRRSTTTDRSSEEANSVTKSKTLMYKDIVNLKLVNNIDSLYCVLWLVYFYEAVNSYGGGHIRKYMLDSSTNEKVHISPDGKFFKIDDIDYKHMPVAHFKNHIFQWQPDFKSTIRTILEDARSPIIQKFSEKPVAFEMFVNIFANKTVFSKWNGLDLEIARSFVIFSLLNFNSRKLLENYKLYEICTSEKDQHYMWFLIKNKKVAPNPQYNISQILGIFDVGNTKRDNTASFNIDYPYYFESFLKVIKNNDVFTYAGPSHKFKKYLMTMFNNSATVNKSSKGLTLRLKYASLMVEDNKVGAIYEYGLHIYQYFIEIKNNTKAQECLENIIPSLNEDEFPVIQKIVKNCMKPKEYFIVHNTKLDDYYNKKEFVEFYNYLSKQGKVFLMIKALLNFTYEYFRD